MANSRTQLKGFLKAAHQQNVLVIAYADDMSLLAPIMQLLRLFPGIYDYLSAIGMELNLGGKNIGLC